jgi:flagellar protein FlaG
MPASSATQLIFFIASIMIATSLVGVFLTTTYDFARDIQRDTNNKGIELQTDIKIVNDPDNMPYNYSTSVLTIYVKNTGSVPITNASKTLVLINGTAFSGNDLVITMLGNATGWFPEETAMINVTIPLSQGYYELKVVVQGGKFDKISFNIN